MSSSNAKKKEVWVWQRGRWHKKTQGSLSANDVRKIIGIASVLFLLASLLLFSFSPQKQEWVVVKSTKCDHGGTYWTSISTGWCGRQVDVCVTFDYDCGNDYHPPPLQVLSTTPVYAGPASLFLLLGVGGLVILYFACLPLFRYRY